VTRESHHAPDHAAPANDRAAGNSRARRRPDTCPQSSLPLRDASQGPSCFGPPRPPPNIIGRGPHGANLESSCMLLLGWGMPSTTTLDEPASRDGRPERSTSALALAIVWAAQE